MHQPECGPEHDIAGMQGAGLLTWCPRLLFPDAREHTDNAGSSNWRLPSATSRFALRSQFDPSRTGVSNQILAVGKTLQNSGEEGIQLPYFDRSFPVEITPS